MDVQNHRKVSGCKLKICRVTFTVVIRHGLLNRLLNRWTDIFILPRTPWGLTFKLNNGTKTQSIFVKLSENIFLGMSKVRAWLIFTLLMP